MTKISKENAETQLQLLLDYYLIETKDINQSESFYQQEDDLEKAKKSSCDRLIRYIQHGLIEITDENGLTVTQRLRKPIGELTQLVYKTVTGNAQREMRWAADNDYIGKICCLMGALASVSADVISKFEGPDAGAVQCLGMIFLTA